MAARLNPNGLPYTASNLQATIRQYQTVGQRDAELFDWLYDKLYRKMVLTSVEERWRPRLQELKAQSAVFITLLDDVADNEKLRDMDLLKKLMEIPFADKSEYEDSYYYQVCWQMWQHIHQKVQTFPHYPELRHFLDYDLRQVMNAELHSLLINANYAGSSVIENDTYGHHGTLLMVHGTWDLMCSPDFNFAELGDVREAVYHASCAARLCNMINTYTRELNEGDFSSPIILHCCKTHNLAPTQLLDAKGRELLKESRQHYENLIMDHIASIRGLADRVESVDLDHLAAVFESIYEDHRVPGPYWLTRR
jgi:hypothetical protein